MGLFYDPIAKKPKVWVIAVFVIVPILVLVMSWVVGEQKVKEKSAQTPGQTQDIFERF